MARTRTADTYAITRTKTVQAVTITGGAGQVELQADAILTPAEAIDVAKALLEFAGASDAIGVANALLKAAGAEPHPGRKRAKKTGDTDAKDRAYERAKNRAYTARFMT